MIVTNAVTSLIKSVWLLKLDKIMSQKSPYFITEAVQLNIVDSSLVQYR